MRRAAIVGTIALLMLRGGSIAVGEVRLAHIFQDNMVLQRGMPVPVWGWADPGATVEATFAGRSVEANANGDGYWRVVFPAMDADASGGPLTVRVGDESITRENVVVGEVWLAAGQSNMNHAGPNRPTGVHPHHVSPNASGGPDVRITRFGAGATLAPQADAPPYERGDAPWTVLPSDKPITSVNAPTGFGCFLRDKLDVPVGIIHVAVSGTNQGAWMRRETLQRFPGRGDFADYFEELFADRDKGQAQKNGAVKSWADFERAMAAWLANPQGRSPADMAIMNYPTTLYNTRIHPLAPFALRGAIWHQGEAGPGGPYGQRLAAMIEQWREQFGQDFFFLFGTLSRNTSDSPPIEPAPTWFYRSSTNGEIRKAADFLGDDGRAAMVELYDLGDDGTHFLQKAEAGRRYGLAALALAYGQDAVFSGPVAKGMTIVQGRAVVRFDRVGEGLVHRPSIDGISGVYIQGRDESYRWADVEVIGKDAIAISHPDVTEITAVGYAVNGNPHETLFNSEGFPASPFARGMDRLPWSGNSSGTRLVALDDSGEGKPTISITHVRRDGYVFQLLRGRDADAPVRAYVPSEWDAYAVECEGKTVDVVEEIDGDARFVKFTAPVGGAWIIVARKDRVADFRDVDRY